MRSAAIQEHLPRRQAGDPPDRDSQQEGVKADSDRPGERRPRDAELRDEQPSDCHVQGQLEQMELGREIKNDILWKTARRLFDGDRG